MGYFKRLLAYSGWFLRHGFLAICLVSLAMPAAGFSPAPVPAGSSLQAGTLVSNSVAVQAAGTQASIPGISVRGQKAIAETTAQIMARQNALAQQPQAAPIPLFNGKLSPGARQPNPASSGALPVAQLGNQTGGPTGPAAASSVVLGLTFNGPDSTVTGCNLTPPDTMGAVGPTQFIITVNCRFVSYNKTTGAADGVLNASPSTFFDSVRNNVGVSDPHIRYDRTSGRWIIVMINVAFPDNRIMLAVSNSATITNTTTWFLYSFQDSITGHTTCLGDYPTPGVDANAIYIGINQFCGATLQTAVYLASDGFVVQKSSVLSGGAIHITAFSDLTDEIQHIGLFTPQGVDNPDPNATEGYFIGVDGASFGLIQLRRVTNPGTASPTISGNISISVALQTFPIPQPHMGNTGGTNGNLDASDGRLFEAYFRNGSLWISLDSGASAACTATGTIDRDAVFWYEITGIPTGSTPSVRQSGEVCDMSASNPAFYSYGTIMVSGQGHIAVGYTIAGATNFTTPGVSTRLVTDPLSTLTSSAILVPDATFLNPYNPPTDPGGLNGRRWGDFSYTSLDPCDDMTLWTVQEYASSENVYGMRVAQLMAPPLAAPASASPSQVAAGHASLNVTITGTSTGGSGFYDTPASLTDACRKRITASVSGGVTVNSVTFTDPTHVTLNISTVGATPGTKDVTITNPDGQSATGTAILTVSGIASATTTALTSSLNPSTFNQSVKFTASITSASGTPGGSVTFFDNGVSLATVGLTAGSADFTTSTLAAGTHPITATYSGDASFLTSNGSLSGGQVVNQAATTLTLTPDRNPSQVGQPVTFTAEVTSSPGLIPTGAVTITLDGSPTVVPLNAIGIAKLTSATLARGAHPASAVFTGSANFAASAQVNLSQVAAYMTYAPTIFK